MNYREMNQNIIIDENYMLKKYNNLMPILMNGSSAAH